jgi:hypothetical protein
MEIVKHIAQAKCECMGEILEVEHDDEYKNFTFTQFVYGKREISLKRRIKFLFTGKLPHNEIILDHTNAQYIADYLNEHLNKK